MEDDSHREHVALWIDMSVFCESDDFWGDIARSAASIEQVFFLIGVGSKAKINDDWL